MAPHHLDYSGVTSPFSLLVKGLTICTLGDPSPPQAISPKRRLNCRIVFSADLRARLGPTRIHVTLYTSTNYIYVENGDVLPAFQIYAKQVKSSLRRYGGVNRDQDKKDDRESFVARASSTDPEAHVMRNGEGGTVPSYNVQRVTDTAHRLIVNVEATTDAIDHRQLAPALNRCAQTLERHPQQVVADGDYTHHASVQAAANCGVDSYGSWLESWEPGERDAQGRRAAFLASAFPYQAERDCFTCPAGETLFSTRS